MEDNLKFLKMEDDLNILDNGRWPKCFEKWKTTSMFWKMENNNLKIFKKNATLNISN
jgi:hypothetical protein